MCVISSHPGARINNVTIKRQRGDCKCYRGEDIKTLQMSRSQGEKLYECIKTYFDNYRHKSIATVRPTDSQFLLASEARMLKLKIFETCEDNRGAGDNINNVSE